jgi:UDP-galactopyranose mutase
VTTIAREYPEDYGPGREPDYPVPTVGAKELCRKYAGRGMQRRR